MYEYSKGNYVYSGGQGYGSPIRENGNITKSEYDKLERLDKAAKAAQKAIKGF